MNVQGMHLSLIHRSLRATNTLFSKRNPDFYKNSSCLSLFISLGLRYHRVGFSHWWTIGVTFLPRCSATPSSTAEINTQPLFNQTVSADYLALIHRFDYLGLINLEIGEEIRRRILNRQCSIREKIDRWTIKESGITSYELFWKY